MSLPFLKRYLIALDKYKWVGLATLATSIGVSGIVALQPPEKPQYKAEGILLANKPPVSFTTTGTEILEKGLEQLTPEILLADTVLVPVAQKVKTTPRVLQRSLKVNIQQAKGPSRTAPTSPFKVEVAYTGDEPQQPKVIVDLAMQGMIEKSRELNASRLKSTIDALNQRIPAATQELRAAEARLEEYDRREGPALLAAQNGSLIAAITAGEQQQRQTILELQGVDTQMASLQQRLGLNPDQAYAASALSSDPIIASLQTQIHQTETQIQINSKNLRPEHPTMVDLQKQLQSYEQLLQQRATEVIGGNNLAAPLTGGSQIRFSSSLDPSRQQLANTLVGLQTQRETLLRQLVTLQNSDRQLRATYANIPNKQLERSRLEQQVTLKRALFDKMQSALVDARAAEAETVSSLTTGTAAKVEADIKPPKSIPIVLGIGVLLGLVGGGGIVFLLSALEGRFYTLEEVRSALQSREVPLLGVLPDLSGLALDDAIPVVIESDSPYADFYERLRSNLRQVEGKKVKILLFTSTLEGEGKTTTAYNLAIASARAGMRTLMLEADLRSASEVRALNIAIDPESLTEPLRYYGQISDCVRLVPQIENLYVVPSVGPQRQAAAILESSEIRRLLDDVRGRFDMVIVDAPSLSRCNDALLLEPMTDGLLLVTRPGYTEGSLLYEVIDQLTNREEIRFIGSVINGADVSIRTLGDEDGDDSLDDSDQPDTFDGTSRIPTGVQE